MTSLINNLYALTHQENDYATQSMLKWFVDEQVEEEENATNIIDNLKMLNGNGYGIFMMDKDLAPASIHRPPHWPARHKCTRWRNW